MLELSNENLSTAKASNSLTTKAKSLVACGRLKPNSVRYNKNKSSKLIGK
jgi:hypothetical protein